MIHVQREEENKTKTTALAEGNLITPWKISV